MGVDTLRDWVVLSQEGGLSGAPGSTCAHVAGEDAEVQQPPSPREVGESVLEVHRAAGTVWH